MNDLTNMPPAVVLIEDDPNVTLMLTRHLQRAGWTVHAAGTLAAAREVLQDQDWDVVLLDRGLPDGDGLELCREIRSQFPHGYVVMLTGESSDAAKLEGFEGGADDYVTKPFQTQELLARLRAALRIVRLQKALIATNQQLEELSVTDGLTSLRNRRAFDEHLRGTYEQARRYERPLSLAVIDIDHFKAINDVHGHAAGDSVLRAVAQMLDGDTRSADFVGRVGGEEFAIVLPETGLFEALQFAEKIRATIASATIRLGDVAHHVTVSVGIASIPHSRVRDAGELYVAADEALYRAKNRGRNRVEIEKRRDRNRPAEAAPYPRQHLTEQRA